MAETKKMSKDELNQLVGTMLDDASTYVKTELEPSRATATEYYQGEPLGNEEEGRSQVVLTELRDTTLGVMPAMLRATFGADHTVEFAPSNPEQVKQAEQATVWVRHVFEEENEGFLKTYGVLKDGFVRGLGIFKWGWNDKSSIKTYAAKGVTQSQVEQLLEDEAVKLTRVVRTKEEVPGRPGLVDAQGQPTNMIPPQEAEYDIEFTRDEKDGEAWIEMVPPNELLFNRESRGLKHTTLISHEMEKTASELLELGVSQKDIDEHGGPREDALGGGLEEIARMAVQQASPGDDPEAGEANDKHVYHESYIRIDYDGDGYAELRRICTLGPGHYVVSNEPTDEIPFSIFVPDPEPHTLLGGSLADLTMDIQKIKSSVLRAALDSLSLALFPRVMYEEGYANETDILNNEIGAPIRMRKPGAVGMLEIPFVGNHALPILGLLDDIKEGRTGLVKGGGELDADALQSTEKAAAQQSMTSSMARGEMFLRIFAETALKPMFRGLLRLYSKHQPKAKMLKIRGVWEQLNPATWDADLSVRVNVMLGTGLVEQKLGALEAFAAKQELIIQTFGPQNPGVKFGQYINTIRQAGKLRGFQNMDDFFTEVPLDWAPPAPPQQPDPKLLEVQLKGQIASAEHERQMQQMQMDAEKDKADRQLEIARLQLDAAKLRQEAILAEAGLKQKYSLTEHQTTVEADRVATDSAIRIKEMELKYGTDIDKTQFSANVETAHKKAEIEAENVRHAAKIASELQIERERGALEHERSLVEMQNKHEQAMKPEPAPAPAAAPAAAPVEIHQHAAPDLNVKVVRDKDGKIAGLSTGSKKGQVTNG